jgi:hypothetical protein
MGAEGRRFARPALDEYRLHAGTPGGFDVTPSVTYAHAACKVEIQPLRGPQQHAGMGLAARAGVTIVVRAHKDLVQWHQAAQSLVHPVDLGAGLRAPGDVWLIGYDDEDEACPPQSGARLGDTGKHTELLERSGRRWHAVTDERLIEHSVPVEENRRTAA